MGRRHQQAAGEPAKPSLLLCHPSLPKPAASSRPGIFAQEGRRGPARIREQGVDVFGFGEQKTRESFRQASRRFTYTEDLLPDAPANAEAAESKSKPLQPPSAAAPIIRRVLDQVETEDGWASLSAVGKQLSNLSSDFDPRNFGFRKLSDLVRGTNVFEIENPEGRGMRIRKKPAPAKPKPKS
ncbi:NYN domain protein [Aminobacter aminovorans]|nr:NYN domain protein [Aminobacter aminovorans]